MDPTATAAAIAIAGTLGGLTGALLSLRGWMLTSSLLVLVLLASACGTGAALLPSLGLTVLVLLAFNAGLVAGVAPRLRNPSDA